MWQVDALSILATLLWRSRAGAYQQVNGTKINVLHINRKILKTAIINRNSNSKI
jgi:hypothetical protein